MDRFGINRKLSFFSWLIRWKEKNTTVEKVTSENKLRVTNEGNQRPIELKIFPARQPYIPYAVAVSFITKMTDDLYQVQQKHKQITKKIEFMRKEKSDHDRKMQKLRRVFEAYHNKVVEKNEHWKGTVEALMKRNRELLEESRSLRQQASQENEKWEREKTWLLETCTQKMNILHIHHSLTTQELQEVIMELEKVQENLKFAHGHPNPPVSPGKMLSWDVNSKEEQESKNKFGNAINTVAEGKNVLLEKHIAGALVTLGRAKQTLSMRERTIKEVLHSESELQRVARPQETIHRLLNILVSTVHVVYQDIPAAQQRIHHLLTNSDAEVFVETGNHATWANTSSHEVFCKNTPEDIQRRPMMTKTHLNHQELEKITLDCIKNGKLPKFLIADRLLTQTEWDKYQTTSLTLNDA